MSEIVIRHAEIEDAPALQQIYARPAVYRDTLQIPHPPLRLWTERSNSLNKPG